MASSLPSLALSPATKSLYSKPPESWPKSVAPKTESKRDCHVAESSANLVQIGAGFQITPNGATIFRQIGVYADLEPKAAIPTLLQVRRYSDGKVLSRTEAFDDDLRKKYRVPFLDLHRVDVQRTLAARAKVLGVRLRLGCRVADVDFDAAKLKLESGEEVSGDLLVGADGLWSKCRERFLVSRGLQPDVPLPTGDLAYRIVLNLDDIDDPELKAIVANPTVQFWIGPGAHCVAYSLRAGQMYNVVLLSPDDLPADVARQPASLDEMRKLFEKWDPVLNRFLDQVKTVDKWKLMHRPELESWVSEKGNFVFLGDACHPMLPYLAQGANSSIEDGAVLGYILSRYSASPSNLPACLQLYERLRKERGEAIVRETFAQRDDFHMPGCPEQEARDKFMLSKLETGIDEKFPSRWQCPVVQPWLYGYDAWEEVERAVKERGLEG